MRKVFFISMRQEYEVTRPLLGHLSLREWETQQRGQVLEGMLLPSFS